MFVSFKFLNNLETYGSNALYRFAMNGLSLNFRYFKVEFSDIPLNSGATVCSWLKETSKLVSVVQVPKHSIEEIMLSFASKVSKHGQ